MKKGMKNCRKWLLCAAVAVCLFASLLVLKWDAIFQRGNPIPYLVAAVQLSDENTFVEVKNMKGVFITKRGDKQDLFRMIEDTYGVQWKDQLGSGYLFSNGENSYIVGSEIYWGRFTVWTASFENGT